MENDITGEAEEIRAAIRAGAVRQYLDRKEAAAVAVSAGQAPIWQQRLDALRAKHKEEEARLMAAAFAAIYGEEAIDAELKSADYEAERVIYKEARRVRRLAWRREYYQKRKRGAACGITQKPNFIT